VPGMHPGPDAVPPVAGRTGVAWQVRALEVDRGGAIVGGPSAGSGQPGGAGL
jgi:hypothetical protein